MDMVWENVQQLFGANEGNLHSASLPFFFLSLSLSLLFLWSFFGLIGAFTHDYLSASNACFLFCTIGWRVQCFEAGTLI